MTDANPENEPSMEEILASIRRIISDGDEGEAEAGAEGEKQEQAPAPAAEEAATEAPSEVFSALPKGEPEAEEDILDLTQMVNEQGEVVDLNEAKSARGLAAAVAEPADQAESPAAAPDSETDIELTMEGLARALDDVIGETPVSEENDDSAASAPEAEPAESEEVVLAVQEEPIEVVEQHEEPVEVVEQLEAPVEVEEPLSPLDALAEIQALAEQQAELQAEMEAESGLQPEVSEAPQAPEVPEVPQVPEVEPAPEALAPELQASQPESLEPEVPVEAANPVVAPEPEAPLELVDQLAAEPSPDDDDDALSEIDQILARAREAAQAQAAKILEDEPQDPPLSPEDQTAALLAGLEQPEEVSPSAGQGIPEDIRTAVEESLGGGARESEPGSRGQDPFQAVIQAEANMAGAEAQADSGVEEQNLADRKDSSHPDYRSHGDESESGLISSNTAAGAIAALGDLSRAARETTGGQGGAGTAMGMNRTLEELVLDAMTPHLKAWLDANLEPLVERVVREEIQRLRRRSEDY